MPYKNSRVDQVLTNLSLDHRPMGFICDMVLTPLSVMKWSGKIGGYGNQHLRLKSSRVYDRGVYKTVQTVEYNTNTSYELVNHGLQDIVTERDREEVEAPFMIENDVTMGLADILKREKEYQISQLMRMTSTYKSGNTVTLSGNSQFSDFSNSDPTRIFSDAINQVVSASGVIPETAIIPYRVLQKLRSHPKLTGIYGSTGKFEQISVDQIKSALGIKEILVPYSQYVNDSGTLQFFWGKDVIVYNRAMSAAKYQRTFGYYITKSGHQSRVFRKDHPDIPNSIKILSDMAYNWQISESGAGYLIKNAIA